jgi:hypothetical protein
MNKPIVYLYFTIFLLVRLSVMGKQSDLHWVFDYGNDSFDTDIRSITTDKANHLFLFTDFEDQFQMGEEVLESNGDADLALVSINQDGSIA